MKWSHPDYHLRDKNLAFVFSDPAGANACTALAKMVSEVSRSTLLYTNRVYRGNIDFPINFCENVPSLEKIDVVFLGTSHPTSSGYYELQCLKAAKRKGIYTISFVDHWVNFKLRFIDYEGTIVYPDEIWVIDDKAKQLAIEEGLPRELLRISGNPYHEYLRYYWTSKWKEKNYLSILDIPQGGYHILFAPDPLTLRNSHEKVGFTEMEGLRSILNVIGEFKDGNLKLILKCHPLQPKDLIEEELNSGIKNNVILIKDADTLELINASDLVIGFYSNCLLDAEALGKNVIRYFPGNNAFDLLAHKTSMLKSLDEKSLYGHFKNLIYG